MISNARCHHVLHFSYDCACNFIRLDVLLIGFRMLVFLMTTNVGSNITANLEINMTTNAGINRATNLGIDMTTNVENCMDTNVTVA